MVDKYIELSTAKAAADTEEALGRAYAASLGKPWPMPPDAYGPGRQPEPRAAYYQRYLVRAMPTAKGAAVLPVDATVDALNGATATLSDGTSKTLDVRTTAKLATDLSADAKAALDPAPVSTAAKG